MESRRKRAKVENVARAQQFLCVPLQIKPSLAYATALQGAARCTASSAHLRRPATTRSADLWLFCLTRPRQVCPVAEMARVRGAAAADARCCRAGGCSPPPALPLGCSCCTAAPALCAGWMPSAPAAAAAAAKAAAATADPCGTSSVRCRFVLGGALSLAAGTSAGAGEGDARCCLPARALLPPRRCRWDRAASSSDDGASASSMSASLPSSSPPDTTAMATNAAAAAFLAARLGRACRLAGGACKGGGAAGTS